MIRFICILFILIYEPVVALESSETYLLTRLVDNKCSEFSYEYFDEAEFSSAVVYTEECVDRYIQQRKKRLTDLNIFYITSRLVWNNRKPTLLKLFSYSLEHHTKEVSSRIIIESYFYGFNIKEFEAIYSEKYSDYKNLESAIFKEYGKR